MRTFLILLFCSPFYGFTQSLSTVNFVLDNSKKNKSGVILQNDKKKSVSSVVLYPSYWLYKQFVSSQDGAMCSFYPSCANYGLSAVANKGFLGIFYAMDRVSRCHGIYPNVYHTHETGLNIDEAH